MKNNKTQKNEEVEEVIESKEEIWARVVENYLNDTREIDDIKKRSSDFLKEVEYVYTNEKTSLILSWKESAQL